MRPSQFIKLASDANNLFYDIEKTKDFGTKLEKIRAALLKYHDLGEKSYQEDFED